MLHPWFHHVLTIVLATDLFLALVNVVSNSVRQGSDNLLVWLREMSEQLPTYPCAVAFIYIHVFPAVGPRLTHWQQTAAVHNALMVQPAIENREEHPQCCEFFDASFGSVT